MSTIDWLTGLVACLSMAYLVAVACGVCRYLRWFKSYPTPPAIAGDLPYAAIVLSLRGAAPTLTECLESLSSQQYPAYEIHVVIDHPTDPSLEIVQQWQARHPEVRISISFLQERSRYAYLKTSAVLQCISSLSTQVKAMALVDADTIAYPNMLHDLVSPLQKSEIGLVAGNLWYDPSQRSWGTSVRFIYNTICVPPMYFMKATWGGALALRREVFDSEFFRQKMLDTPCEDLATQAATRHLGFGIEPQANVMILNRESCTLLKAFEQFRRWLLWTRLYHPAWATLLLGCWSLHFIYVLMIAVGVYHAVSGNHLLGAILAGILIFQILAYQCLAEWLHRTISRRALQVQGEAFAAINWRTRLRLFVAFPLAFVMLCYAMLAAAVARRVTWSGITYQVMPPSRIRMNEYVTWREASEKHIAETVSSNG